MTLETGAKTQAIGKRRTRLSAVASEVPEMIAGAGTVLNSSQAEQAIEAGAKFVVSPGLDEASERRGHTQ